MDVIGDYKIRQELLTTSFSDIYVGKKEGGDSLFAIKVFHPKGKNVGEKASYGIDFWRARFEEEANLLRALDHPNIISVIDAGETADGVPYFVMPFMEANLLYEIGDDANTAEKRAALDPRWHPRALSPRRSVEIWREILSALAELHDRELVHRDIKPSNILLTSKKRGRAVLGDFGMVKVPDATGSKSGRWIGTLDYISPEQRASATDVDSRSDVYSVAALIYRMLSGRLPHGRYVPLRGQRVGLPEEITKLIGRCLSKRRRDRPTSAADVLSELDFVIPDISMLSDRNRLEKRGAAVNMPVKQEQNNTLK